MDYSRQRVGNNQMIFNGKDLTDFKTKQIKDFMNLNYGIRSRREHFSMESVNSDQVDDQTSNDYNYVDDQSLDNNTYLVTDQDEDIDKNDTYNLEKMMKLNSTYKNQPTPNIKSTSVRMRY